MHGFALNIKTVEKTSKSGKVRKIHDVVLKQNGVEKIRESYNSKKKADEKYNHLRKLFIE